MSINSMIFLTAFLPVVFVLDRLCVRKTALKNILLLLASLVFYAWGEPVYIVLLLVSIAANYGIGLLLGCQRDESVAAKAVLAAGILVNLGILGYYKYFDFFLRIVNRLTGSEHEMRNIPLPIGISFFTFGAISYLMDLYRGHYEAEITQNIRAISTIRGTPGISKPRTGTSWRAAKHSWRVSDE